MVATRSRGIDDMCFVSMVHEHYEPFFPAITSPTTVPTVVVPQPTDWPSVPARASSQWVIDWGNYPRPKTLLDLFEEAVAAVRRLDAALGLADCDTAEKTEWMKKLRKAVRDHERAELDKRLKEIAP